MAQEKVYSPETIEDIPLPTDSGSVSADASSSGSGERYHQQETENRPLPRKIIAQETIGSALNTKSKKILAEFQFTELGAIRIGRYQEGISGEMTLTPAGLTGRNTSGNTTLAFDVETGDAIFAGELRSGTLITGQIIVGNNTWIIDGDPDFPSIKLFNNGVCEILIGEP